MTAVDGAGMTPERWREVQRLFEEVLEKRPDERAAALEQATVADPALRREVVSLIRSLESASRFLEEPAWGEPTPADPVEPFAPGIEVGAYRLERLLGSGGAGQVFLAERADAAYEKKVAVKVLKRGMDTDELVRRFVSERQILAQLEHPNIAQLLDGGATGDGRPYLVMEYVDGMPIDRWCRRHGLGVRRRLELFLAVCDAVRFAHRNLVIHRDLKPGNVLVDGDGVPKLLDFGIAKLLDPATFPRTVLPTAPGWRAMTPEYASPEQVRGAPVTTATDVYALGVMLYELLTGRRPYRIAERTPAAVERAVCLEEPPRASRRARDTLTKDAAVAGYPDLEPREVARRLAGDLDAILQRALEKDPERRYSSVDQLAADLRRHLDGRPVLARKDTSFYRASKFVRRHSLAVTVATLVFALLIAFAATLWFQRRAILQQRDRAELVSGFMTELFEVSNPSRERGETITARELLDKGARDAEARLRDRPGLLGDLLGTMGTTYTNLGLYAEAGPLLERSLALRREAYGSRDPAVATAEQQLADLAFATDDLERAERLGRSALARRRARFGDAHPEVVESRFRLALVRQRQGDREEAGALLAEAEAEARQLGLDDALVRILVRRGILDRLVDDLEASRRHLEEALAVAERVWGEIHPEVARILGQLAEVERHRDVERARALLERALDVERQVFKGPHPDTAQTLNNLAALDEQLGRTERAEERYREVLAMLRSIYLEPGLFEASVGNNLALLLVRQGRFEEAEDLYREALEAHRRVLGPRHPDTANVLSNLGGLLQRMGRREEAERHYRQALEIFLETLGEDHSRVAPVLNNLGQLALARGDLDAAAQALERAAASLRSISTRHAELPAVLQNLAAVAARRGEAEPAEELYREALEVLDATGDAESPAAAAIHANLAVAKIRAGELEDAVEWGRRAVALYEGSGGRGGVDWLRARRLVAIALERQERLAEAEAVAAENLAVCVEHHGEAGAECPRHRQLLDRIRTAVGGSGG